MYISFFSTAKEAAITNALKRQEELGKSKQKRNLPTPSGNSLECSYFHSFFTPPSVSSAGFY